jgi:hypothetical protein
LSRIRSFAERPVLIGYMRVSKADGGQTLDLQPPGSSALVSRDPGLLCALGGTSLRDRAALEALARLGGHIAVERGMAPVAAGLFLSSGLVVLRASPGRPAIWIAATAALTRQPGRRIDDSSIVPVSYPPTAPWVST